mmetsp:Transcript_160/g.293  ORF Transcript_160/g.293 Transcript_160/m.293 type:complete len:134 (+) Transcript_160:183-584(+)
MGVEATGSEPAGRQNDDGNDSNSSSINEASQPQSKPMTKIEKKRMKKKRKLVKSHRGNASDYYDVYGEDARATVEITDSCPPRIRIRDIQVRPKRFLSSHHLQIHSIPFTDTNPFPTFPFLAFGSQSRSQSQF